MKKTNLITQNMIINIKILVFYQCLNFLNYFYVRYTSSLAFKNKL